MMIELPQYICEILQIFQDNGYPCFVIGGAIRDYLLNKPVTDYDLATSIDGKAIKRLFKGNRFINNNGERHGTYTLRYKGHNVEITTFKHNDDEPNTLESDVTHRDLNINSIAYDGEQLIDYRNGIDDLDKKIISMGNNPEKIIDEDPNRILRAIRLSCILDFEIDKATKDAIKDNYIKLGKISKERIVAELNKIMVTDKTKEILLEYKELFAFLFPDLKPCIGFDQKSRWHKNDLYTHTVNVVGNTPKDLTIRYAALFHDIGKIKTVSQEYINDVGYINHYYGHPIVSKELTGEILKEYKFSNQDRREILYLVENHDTSIAKTKKNIKKAMQKAYNYGFSNTNKMLSKLIDLQNADRIDHTTVNLIDKEEIMLIIEEITKEKEVLKVTDLKVDGNDLLKLGYEGKQIGNILKELLQLVVDEQIPNKRKKLLEYINEKRVLENKI